MKIMKKIKRSFRGVYRFDSFVGLFSPFKGGDGEFVPLKFVSLFIPRSFLTAVERRSMILST